MTLFTTIVGASLSEPHTSESNGGFFIYILYIIIIIYLPYVFRKCKFNSFNPNFAHADPCGPNIEKNTWSKNKDGTRTLRYSV